MNILPPSRLPSFPLHVLSNVGALSFGSYPSTFFFISHVPPRVCWTLSFPLFVQPHEELSRLSPELYLDPALFPRSEILRCITNTQNLFFFFFFSLHLPLHTGRHKKGVRKGGKRDGIRVSRPKDARSLSDSRTNTHTRTHAPTDIRRQFSTSSDTQIPYEWP